MRLEKAIAAWKVFTPSHFGIRKVVIPWYLTSAHEVQGKKNRGADWNMTVAPLSPSKYTNKESSYCGCYGYTHKHQCKMFRCGNFCHFSYYNG